MLSKRVIAIITEQIFDLGKALEVYRSVLIIIESQGYVQLDINGSFLRSSKTGSREREVPNVVLWYQEVAFDLVAEQQLTLLAKCRTETSRLV